MEITIIVPCFNSASTLARCLDSLLAQSMPVLIFVMNDGSTDATQELAEQYARKFSNIRVFTHENIGLPQTRKAGLALVTTKYVAFVDSDDWIEPDMIESLYRLAESNRAEITACELICECDGRSKLSKRFIGRTELINGMEALSRIHRRSAVYPYLCNKLFLTDLARTLPFPTGNFIGEDYVTLCPAVEAFQRVAVTDRPLYHYELKLGSMSKSGFGPSHRRAWEEYRSLYYRYCQSHTPQQMEEMANYLCVEYAAIYVSMIRNSIYDGKIQNQISDFLRVHLRSFLLENRNPAYCLSILMIVCCPKLFQVAYQSYCKLHQIIGGTV